MRIGRKRGEPGCNDGSGFDRAAVQQQTDAETGRTAPQAAPAPGELVRVDAHTQLRLNTGAVTTLNLPAPTRCVMAFYAGPNGAQVTGWVPVDKLSPESQRLVANDEQGALRAKAADRPAAGGLGRRPRAARHAAPDIAGREHGRALLPAAAAQRARHEHRSQGVASDVLVAGTQFFEATSVGSEHVPLYRAGYDSAQTDRKLTFVYGKAVTSAGAPTYGWLNRAMLT